MTIWLDGESSVAIRTLADPTKTAIPVVRLPTAPKQGVKAELAAKGTQHAGCFSHHQRRHGAV